MSKEFLMYFVLRRLLQHHNSIPIIPITASPATMPPKTGAVVLRAVDAIPPAADSCSEEVEAVKVPEGVDAVDVFDTTTPRPTELSLSVNIEGVPVAWVSLKAIPLEELEDMGGVVSAGAIVAATDVA